MAGDNLRYAQVAIPPPSKVTRANVPIPVWVRTHLLHPIKSTRVQRAVAIAWTRDAVQVRTEAGRRLWVEPEDVRRR